MIDDDVPDDDDREDEDAPERDFDCGQDIRGHCGKSGSEECEFECPYRFLRVS